MQALLIRGKHDAQVCEVPAPELQEGEALVRVRLCGLCGSDLHAYEGTQPFFAYPQVPGHEVVGDVVEVRRRADGPMRLPGRLIEHNLQTGDRVVLDPAMPCGRCYACTHGRYNCCENMRVIGVHAPGALAEYFCAPAECLYRVPGALSDDLAALIEPLSIGVQANTRARVTSEDTVVVIGAGPIGLCVMLVAKARGAKVIMSDLCAARREKALQMGADAALDPHEEGFRERLRELSQASGPAVVVEAVGTPQTLVQALELVVAGGRVVLLGLITGDVTLPANIIVRKELDFVGSRLHGGTIPAALKLVAQGTVDVASLVTHRCGLEDAQNALQMMADSRDKVLKVLVRIRH